MTTQTPAQVIREAMAKATPGPWTGTAHHIWTRDDAVADCHAQSDTLLIVALVNSGEAMADALAAAAELSSLIDRMDFCPDCQLATKTVEHRAGCSAENLYRALSRVSDALGSGHCE